MIEAVPSLDDGVLLSKADRAGGSGCTHSCDLVLPQEVLRAGPDQEVPRVVVKARAVIVVDWR